MNIKLLRFKFNQNALVYLLVIDILFLVVPIFSLSMQVLILAFNGTKPKAPYVNLILTISLFLGILNLTKVPQSDMLNYLEWYHLASTMPFYDYMFNFGKEPLYFAAVYMISLVSGNSPAAFIVSVTVIGYFVILYSLLRLAFAAQVPAIVVLALIVGVSFFPQLFSISAHLIRQFLAAGLLLLFLVGQIDEGKNNWVLLIGAVLTHSTVALFVPFVFIPLFSRPITFVVITVNLVALGVLVLGLPYISKLLMSTGIDFLAYIGKRAMQREYHTLDSPNVLVYSLIAVGFCLVLFKTYVNTALPETIYTRGYNLSSSMLVIVSSFIVLTSLNPKSYELSARFTFLLYYFIPIQAVIAAYKQHDAILLSLVVMVTMPIYFIARLESGVWIYENYLGVLFQPIFLVSL